MIATYQCADFACGKSRRVLTVTDRIALACSCGCVMGRVLFDARSGDVAVEYEPGSLGNGRENARSS